MVALTRNQAREVDRLAMQELGIPGIVLMENAARQTADHVRACLSQDLRMGLAEARVVVVCGGGNNGGDGYAIARHLHNSGVTVMVYAAADPAQLKVDAATNAQILTKMGLEIRPVIGQLQLDEEGRAWDRAHVLVDAILGTGFTGNLRDSIAAVIDRCDIARQQGPRIVAVDIPSGLDADTGQPSTSVIQADLTVTFAAIKVGFLAPEARRYLGKVVVADIGAPPSLVELARKNCP